MRHMDMINKAHVMRVCVYPYLSIPHLRFVKILILKEKNWLYIKSSIETSINLYAKFFFILL